MKTRRLLLSVIILSTYILPATSQPAKLTFDMSVQGPAMAPDLFGIFFEEINHGGEGGLYGEAIVNRSFDDDYASFYGWTSQDANCSLTQTNLLNSAQRNACRTAFQSSNGWLRNSGFGGIKLVRGDRYKISFWVRSETNPFNGSITAKLVDSSSGISYGLLTFAGPFGPEWKKCTGEIKATANINNGAFQLQASDACTLVFDMVSCFPPTFKDRENGMRKDLGQMLADMKPRFMRFPGGCYVEGRTGWEKEPNNNTRWIWKNTIGPIEERPGHRNQQWGYWVSDGQGYHEFLQFCEDIGAAPMFVCNVGMGHGWVQDYRHIEEYIQEALDAIEYANGDSTSTWGRVRTKNGHPEPFNLKYMEIGNENCNYNFGNNSDQSDHYFERYIQFYNAIKSRFPDVITIGNVEAWSTDNPSWRSNYPIELVDEHYYRDANFYINNYEKYNGYSRAGAEIYIGEYAANVGGGIGNLNNALAEAIFMQGMENNSDIVKMASFAPIFMNETYGGWNYDIIRFNHQTSYGIPSYYVQKMFGNNQGTYAMPWTEENNIPTLSSGDRHIGVGTWLTTATFSDIELTSPEGEVYFSQKANNSSVWTRGGGTWAYVSGTIRQTNANTEGATYICNLDLPNENFDYTLNATKTSGTEGFLILFNYKDSQNYTWWNIGGWGNSAYGIENSLGGVRSTIDRKDGTLETNHTYKIKISKRGSNVKCYLDDALIHDVEIPAGYARGVYTSAAYDTGSNEAIIKLTNPNPSSLPLNIAFKNGSPTSVTGEVLTSTYNTDENTTSNPTKVIPRSTNSAKIGEENNVVYEVPAYSFNILRVKMRDVSDPSPFPTLPTESVVYSFESGSAVSDDGRFSANLTSGSSIMEMTDGNHVLYTGNIGGRGFLNLGTEMPKSIFSTKSDYTISMDVLNRTDNNLGSFSWALSLSNGTDQYFGFINSGGNRNWYTELKNGTVYSIRSNSPLRTCVWHNLTYVQESNKGYFYIDGRLYSVENVNTEISAFVNNLTGCYIGRSPFSGDAYMENSYFDNLRIYRQALTRSQVEELWHQTSSMSDDESAQLNTPNLFADLMAEARSVEKYAGSSALTAAVAHAESHSKGTAAELQKEMTSLRGMLDSYYSEQLSLASSGETANLSFLIRNPMFIQGCLYWSGDNFTAITSETAEHFSHTFDNYQIIRNLPAGHYRLEADAFYRAGGIEPAYASWQTDHTSSLRTELYESYSDNGTESEKSVLVLSLYDSNKYTYSPYTYPDNLVSASIALNSTDGSYSNSLEFDINQPSDVRIGIRNKDLIIYDWTSFDNFRLYYIGLPNSIEQIQDSESYQHIIYDISGRIVGKISADNNIHLLKPGIYFINGKKYYIK